jgi:5,10-methylenetetrahydromethanopterin reductase
VQPAAALRGAVGLSIGSGRGASMAEAVELAVEAEAGGLDLVTAGDTDSETFALLGAVAARTSRVTLMSGVAQWTRTPPTMAAAAQTLQNLSGGRYWLGIGPMPAAWAPEHGIAHAPVLGRMRDYVAATRAALAATDARPTAHEGPYFRTVGYRGRPLDRSWPVPLQLAATRPRMTALAAEIADGIMLNAIQPLDWLRGEGAAAIAAGLERSGRPRAALAVGLFRFCGIAADRATAYDHARRALAFYFAIPYLRPLLEPYGYGPELDAGEAALAAGDEDAAAAAVSDRMVEALAIAGTPEQARAQLRELHRHADYVVLSCTHAHDRAAGAEQARRAIAAFGRRSSQASGT